MTYTPKLAERIAWSLAQLPAADGKVLAAVWSSGDYETGRNCRPSFPTLVTRSGVSSGTVKRSLRRLLDKKQPGGPWMVAKRRHRHPTTYDICVDRLSTRPPKEQQMAMAPDLLFDDRVEDHPDPQPGLGDQNDPQTGLEDQNDPQIGEFEDHFDPTTYVRTDLEERTHTPRAREADDHAPLADLPLVGPVPRTPCAHPQKHFWCHGRRHVPRDLHIEFMDQRLPTLPGESFTAKTGRLIAFYVATAASELATTKLATEYRYWNEKFDAWDGSDPRVVKAAKPAAAVQLTARELDAAKQIRKQAYAMRCPHEPQHEEYEECIREIALARKVATG